LVFAIVPGASKEGPPTDRTCAPGGAELLYLSMGFIAGLAASAHCAGMCGAFPLHLSRTAGGSRPVTRQLTYLAGKTLTYAFIGALAGAFGHLILQSRLVSSSQHLLAYAAGGVLVVVGLAMLGLFPRFGGKSAATRDGGFVTHIYGQFFRSPGPLAGLLLGAGTGFLPCPVTIAMAAIAAATHSVASGMIAMAGLSLGTAPALLGIGLSGTLFDARFRRIGLRGAAAIVIVLGVVTGLRPTGILCRFLPVAAPASSQCTCSAHAQHAAGQK